MSRWAALWLALLLSSPCFALSKQEELKQTEAALEQARSRQKESEAATQAAQEELGELQEDLAKTASRLQASERELADIEEKLVILQSQLDEKNIGLHKRRKEMSAMLTAALRLSRTPPEASLMMPGDFLQTLKSARAVDSIGEAVRTDAEELTRQLAELNTLKQKIARSQEAARQKRATLTDRQGELKTAIDTRQQKVENLSGDRAAQEKEMASLAQKASSLKDLLSSLRDSAKTGTPLPTRGSRQAAESGRSLRSFASAKGKIRLPAAGSVLRGYGVALNTNDTTRGVTLRTPAKVSVLAPYDAQVVYAGNFLNYGKLVILRHSDDFHTLVSGLGRIDVDPGQFLLEGEPIGAMGSGSANRLYLELRQHNQPIDPEPWINMNPS